MTINVVFFETATGEIDEVTEYEDGTLTSVITADAAVGSSWIEDPTFTANSEDYYIVNPSTTKVLTVRPAVYDSTVEQLQTDGVDIIDFVLPTGTVVGFDNQTWTSVANEHFQMTSTIVGVYEVVFEPPFPYLPLVLEVQCNAA